MPIYEYRCAACGATFERLVRMGSGEAPACPACGGAQTDRLVSVVARTGGDCGPGTFT